MITIRDINIKDKKVLIRCDFNVPIINGKIQDDNRIVKSIPTIQYAIDNAYKVIIISHLGRIKTKDDMKKNSLKIVCDRLSKLLNIDIKFCTYEDDIKSEISKNKIVMLENIRFFDIDDKKESNNDEQLAKYLSSLCDVYINDAFGVSHRNAASTTGISQLVPSAIGFLMEEEINKLSELFNPKKPFVIILGGSKVSDKIGIISNLIDKVDKMVIVGAMAFTFLKAENIDIGKSIFDEDNLNYCKNLLNKYKDKIILPQDVYVSDNINSKNKILVDIENIPSNMMGLDIGEKTLDKITENIKDSKTIFLNGPAGAFENEVFSYGTKNLLSILYNTNAKVIIGGGDSASAAIKYGYKNKFYHISTGGGASLKFLEGKTLDGLKYIGE